MRIDKLQCTFVPVTIRGHRRLEDDRAAEDVHYRERVQVAVRVDTNDVVQLICEHPFRPPAQPLRDTSGVGLGGKPRAARL